MVHPNYRTIGNGYFNRRRIVIRKLSERWVDDPIVNALGFMGYIPKKVLEIGCSNGWRLNRIQDKYGCQCSGIDPASMAIKQGVEDYPSLFLTEGIAEELPYPDGEFDMVIFGFCLYNCERESFFKIAYQADRVLSEGFLVVHDFYPSVPQYNRSLDCPTALTYKMDYSTMFSWHPAYRIMYRNIRIDPENIAQDKEATVVFKKTRVP